MLFIIFYSTYVFYLRAAVIRLSPPRIHNSARRLAQYNLSRAQNIGPLSKIGTGYKESVTSAFSLESEERMFYRWKSVLNYFTDLAKSKWATEREEAFPITPSQDDVDSMWEMIKDDTGIPNKSPKGRTRNVAQLSITRADRLLKNLGLIDSNKRPRLSRPRSSRRVTRSNTSRMADVV